MGENFGLSENAVKIFSDLYSFQEENIGQTFERVACEFSTDEAEKQLAYDLLAEGYWRPNTPVFLNAGTDHKVFSACYVVGLEDDMDSIYDIANVCRKIFQYGAGVGIPIGNLREKEAWIYEGKPEILPEGKSSGPITFMKLYDTVGETTKSGGRVRRAAILVSMPVWHPDIMDFIECKEVDGRLANMNISVAVTDKFMQSLEDKIPFDLVSPSNGNKISEIDPQVLWGKLSEMAWKTADPGVMFIDNVNKYNPLVKRILINCCNPCGEQYLVPFNACNLSAINIYKFIKDGKFDWDALYDTTFNVMSLMDNLIDVMHFPDDKDSLGRQRFRTNTLRYRPVGVGPMGLADAMFMLGYKYDGVNGRKFAGEVMKTMTRACAHRSALLAKEKGPFHDYDIFKKDVERIVAEHIGDDKEIMALVKENGVRNCQFTTCQPTGTTALSCDASYGIEPSFGLVFQKNLISGETMIVANPVFEKKCKEEGIYSDDLLERIFKNGGSLKGLHNIPKELKRVFVTAHDIKYKDRIDMQAELQKYCSTAISSTVNLPRETEISEISDLYKYAYEKGLKGVTIYRDGTKENQPVTFKKDKMVSADYERPNVLDSKTHIVETGNGKMYVTVCHYEGKPVEIILNLGKSGQILNTLSESLGRVVSIALQNGVPVEEITKTLININSDKMVWWRFEPTDQKPTQILSIPDGIAKLFDRYYSGMKYNGEISGEICEKCGNSMTAMEGCFNCPACGHSKCS